MRGIKAGRSNQHDNSIVEHPVDCRHLEWTASGTEAGEMITAVHRVVPLTLEFTADGKVTGASPDNGCIWLGVWSHGGKGIERMITLDVALTSCKYAGLDRRYTGSFLLAVPDSSGQVSLLAYTPPIPGQKVRGYSLGGTLRRQ